MAKYMTVSCLADMLHESCCPLKRAQVLHPNHMGHFLDIGRKAFKRNPQNVIGAFVAFEVG